VHVPLSLAQTLRESSFIRIGIVDDHPVFRLGLIRLFEREPDLAPVWDVGSLDEVVPMLEKAPVDVILMDLNLGPEQDALAKTRAIKESYENVRVIVISGSLDFEWAAASRAAGANGYLPKDLPVEDMMAAIRGLASPDFGKGSFNDMLSDGPRRRGAFLSLATTLTRREQQVLAELRRGRTNKEIAALLGVSLTTINKHVQQVLKKLKVRTRAQAVLAVDPHVRDRPYSGVDARR
jgi:two-component system, NarL family, nitrate/nitrite response regulator NarL